MFYVPCNPGFEEDLQTEIRECWPWLIALNGAANASAIPEMIPQHGGVSIDAPLELGIQLNFFLKTAHRVLWRVGDFRTRDFPKLFEKVRQIPWEKYLVSNQVEWVVSAGKSRLNNEKRIEETCREAFASVKGLSPGAPQKIYVRIFDDQCTLSLDSSGEHLHKRGWGTRKGEAPLRETLSAFVLRQMMTDASPGELGQITLVDPMCGSGTLLLEAASLWKPNFARAYSFLNWKNTPKLFKTELWKKNYKLLTAETPFAAYRGFDVDEKVLGAARENLQDLCKILSIEKLDIRFEMQDLFAETKDPSFGKVWCIANPPYGERLRVQQKGGKGEFSYDDLLARMAEKHRAQKIGLLLPNKMLVKNIKPPMNYKLNLEIPFSNGGLDVLFLVYNSLTAEPLHPPRH